MRDSCVLVGSLLSETDGKKRAKEDPPTLKLCRFFKSCTTSVLLLLTYGGLKCFVAVVIARPIATRLDTKSGRKVWRGHESREGERKRKKDNFFWRWGR